MQTLRRHDTPLERLSEALAGFFKRRVAEGAGIALLVGSISATVSLATWSVADPSWNHATAAPVRNLLGYPGAVAADLLVQVLGLGAACFLLAPAAWGVRLLRSGRLDRPALRAFAWLGGTVAACGVAGALPPTSRWPLPTGLGGVVGDAVLGAVRSFTGLTGPAGGALFGLGFAAVAIFALTASCGRVTGAPREARPAPAEAPRPSRRGDDGEDAPRDDEPSWAIISLGALAHASMSLKAAARRRLESAVAAAEERRRAAAERTEVAPEPPRPLPSAPSRREPAFEPIRVAAPVRAPVPVQTAVPVRTAEPARTPEPDEEDGPALAPAPLRPAAPVRPVAARAPAPVPPPAEAEFEEAGEDGPEVPAPAAARPGRVIMPGEAARPALAPEMGDEGDEADEQEEEEDEAPLPRAPEPPRAAAPPRKPVAPPAPVVRVTAAPAPSRGGRPSDAGPDPDSYELPPLPLLAEPKKQVATVSKDALEQNATLLESTLEDFGIRGEIINVRPGPVVTLYELEPAPGTKSSRVIGLADDIARSMSAVSARVAVVQGRNVIGIELPNQKRETVFLRELIAAPDFQTSSHKLAIALGKTIGGEPVIADLARMPHLLVAGTTGSGKSVAINTMILSLLYTHKPEQCRLIMVDPKMLELSVYDGIPHLLTPVVTDPKKAVVALKWAVREMEERYKKMSKLGVRNIDGFNARVAEAKSRHEVITRTVQTGFDRETGEAVYEDEVMDLDPLPYIVVIVDEMADLMMVAGKDIEGAIQRLAQMARAAGIHLIMATQRPSVDVITGTIKANFPTRISFQVTSKIDSRTILGEMGAEQLLGQGDMLYMAGGGRITRVHGPFVSDAEVEKVVAHLKSQGRPQYLDSVTAGDEDGPEAGGSGEDGAVFDKGALGAAFGEEGGDPYDQAVAVVLRDKKASTSYIQRRLGIGYNRAASIMERMEKEGIVGPANHAGKREILLETSAAAGSRDDDD